MNGEAHPPEGTIRAPKSVRLGTRGSELALRQAELVANALTSAHPGLTVERVIIRTIGDRVLDAPLSKIGGKGLFTKELETALEDGSIDLAVHSLKDLPTELPARLRIGAVLEREDPRDALVSNGGRRLDELPAGARVGTSSLRRRAQILARRPDLHVEDVRGNVPTRLEKVRTGALDAVVVARAGVVRLGRSDEIAEVLDPGTMLPAAGQGAIAVEVRAQDAGIAGLVAPVDHEPTRLATTAERALLARLEGGCQVPIGALAEIEEGAGAAGVMTLRAVVADLDGRTLVRASESATVQGAASPRSRSRSEDRRAGRAPVEAPGASSIAVPFESTAPSDDAASAAAALGVRCAERLLEQGAGPILARVIALARGDHLSAQDGPEDGP